MPCSVPGCTLNAARTTNCVGIQVLSKYKEKWESGQTLSEAEQQELRDHPRGADCLSGAHFTFHQQCYGRNPNLAFTMKLFKGVMNSNKTLDYTMNNARHHACDLCLLNVTGSTDVLYTNFSESDLQLVKQRAQRSGASKRKKQERIHLPAAGVKGAHFILFTMNPVSGAGMASSKSVQAIMDENPELQRSLRDDFHEVEQLLREKQATEWREEGGKKAQHVNVGKEEGAKDEEEQQGLI